MLDVWVMRRDGWNDNLAMFHGNITPFVFADSHVETRKWLDGATIKQAQLAAQGKCGVGWWGGGGPTNPDFAWMWDHYRFQNWTPL